MFTNIPHYCSSIITADDTERLAFQEKELARKQQPTEAQIVLLRQYLKAFKIKVPIPHFSTVAEMDRWKLSQVKKKLGC